MPHSYWMYCIAYTGTYVPVYATHSVGSWSVAGVCVTEGNAMPVLVQTYVCTSTSIVASSAELYHELKALLCMSMVWYGCTTPSAASACLRSRYTTTS